LAIVQKEQRTLATVHQQIEIRRHRIGKGGSIASMSGTRLQPGCAILESPLPLFR